MSKEKKVILIIVEGTSDKVSLQAIFENYFDPLKSKINVIHYDIIQQSTPQKIRCDLNKKIQEFCSIEKIKPRDIKKIIHIVDTDGAFIPSEKVQFNFDGSGISYGQDYILTGNRDGIIARNQNKSSILDMLSKIENIQVTSVTTNIPIPYSIFYFFQEFGTCFA